MGVLTEAEFLTTMGDAQAVGLDSDAPRFWAYFDALPVNIDGQVFDGEKAYGSHITCGGRWQHIALGSLVTANVFLVIVVDLRKQTILGHHVLDLNEKYGLNRTGSA